MQPLGLWRTVVHLASLGGLGPELALAAATGNVARWRKLPDRGVIAPGRRADLVFLDQASGGADDGLLVSRAQGNLPGIGMIMTDGVVRAGRIDGLDSCRTRPSRAVSRKASASRSLTA